MTGLKTLLLLEIKDNSINHKGSKHEEDTGQHPYLNGCQTLCLGTVGVDIVEDVDQDKEERDEESHPAWDNVGGNEEADPGDQDEQTGGEIVGNNVGHHMAGQVLKQNINLSR